MTTAKVTQRDYMRLLVAKHGLHAEPVCRDYACAEATGLVDRASRDRTPEQYAAALYADGITKRWLVQMNTLSKRTSISTVRLGPMDLSSLTPRELLALHGGVSEELRSRGITRSSNNPVGDLAEYLFTRAFGWDIASKSEAHADATDKAGKRYQIKGRRITAHNASRLLGALRELQDGHFEFLAGVLFDAEYRVTRAVIIPHEHVASIARHTARTNSWRFYLAETVWSLPGARDVTAELQLVEAAWSIAKSEVEGEK